MKNIIKFSLLIIILVSVLSLFGSACVLIFDSLGAGLNYATTGNVGVVLESIISFVGFGLDTIFLSNTTSYVTHFGGLSIYNLTWLFTTIRVIFGVGIVAIILQLLVG